MRCGVARRTEKPFSLRWRTALAVSSRTIRGDPHERDREPFENGRRERLTATLDPHLTLAPGAMNDRSAPISGIPSKDAVAHKRPFPKTRLKVMRHSGTKGSAGLQICLSRS